MINPMSNPFYLLPPLFGLVLALLLSLLVLKRGRRGDKKNIFLGLLVSLGLWCLFTFNMRSSPDIHRALPWEKALIVCALSMFVFYYHFTVMYIRKKHSRYVLFIIYSFLGIFSVVLAATDLIIKEMTLKSFGYAPIIGPLGYPVYIFIPLMIIGGIYNLMKAYKRSTSYDERNRLLYLALAGLFPVVGSGLDAMTNLPPMAIWTTYIFCSICSVAIVKYNLFDIRIIIRKSLSYLLVSALLGLPYAGVFILFNHILKTQTVPWWIHIFFIFLLAVTLQPLYGRAQKLVDRLFYRDKFNYLQALEQFSHETQSIINLKRLGDAIVELVVGALHISNACLLLVSETKKGLRVVASTGLEKLPEEPVIRSQSILIKWLKKHKRSLSIDELDISPQLQNLAQREKNNLKSVQSEFIEPIMNRNGELSGILIMGPKQSTQPYTIEDKQLLSTISSQFAMALENASLYEDMVRAKENLEACLNSMSDSVIIINSDLTIEFLNDAAKKRFDEPAADSNKGELDKLNSHVKQTVIHYHEGISNGKPCIQRIGNYEYEIVSTPLVNAHGEISVINVLRDITARKRMEKQKKELERKAQINSRLVSVGEMASGIAHEINNPLTAVIGYTQILQNKKIPGEIREYLGNIFDGAQRVAGIVNRLLVFARQRKPSRSFIDINKILLNTVELCAYNMKTANIKVITDLQPELAGTVADSGQIQQVFLNIIINAEKELEAKGGGILIIATKQIGNFIRISFADNGPGINKKNLERIFDPFFTTRAAGEGTGLGLSVCHGILSEHNGRIYAESEEGMGATFIVELPEVAKHEDVKEGEAVFEEKVEPVKGMKILVVDDEPFIRQMLTQMLGEVGYQVETAGDANSALSKIKQTSYNLILLDVKMPGMSGIEIYHRIEEMAGSLEKKVIIITGDVIGKDTKNFLSQTKTPFITKPFDMAKLRRDIDKVMNDKVLPAPSREI
jgi:signal transduction histidine kinase/CheY-like chemotaxis protein